MSLKTRITANLKGLLKLGAVVFLLVSFHAQAQDTPFYSVEPTLKSIVGGDIGAVRALQISPPPILYHWLSVESLTRLFNGNFHPTDMPLKNLGNDIHKSVLTIDVPPLKNIPGLFTWHNPVGAALGGVSELYGEHEAMLAMKIHPQARIGLIVTQDGKPSEKVNESSLRSQYDLLLHVNFDGGGSRHWVEWVLINPKIVTSYSIDPTETIKVIEQFRGVVENLEKDHGSNMITGSNYIEMIDGPQHSQLSGYFYSDPNQLKNLEDSLQANANRLPDAIKAGWVEVGAISCASVQSH